MRDRIDEKQMSQALIRALQNKLIESQDTATVFYDLSYLKERIDSLIEQFPSTALHALATKANPLPEIIKYVSQPQIGAETATLSEVHLAYRSGYKPQNIVFDSPAKTEDELRFALEKGLHINIDSFGELQRIAGLKKQIDSSSNIGLRVNPNVGMGKIGITSVAGSYSKFGIPLDAHREGITDAYLENEWLNGIHLHIGSQGCSLKQLVTGVEKVLTFAVSVNERLVAASRPNRIEIIDIGGGLPVSYHKNKSVISFKEYKAALAERCPELFGDRFKIITEFGRHIYANTGWIASRVEYVKKDNGTNTVINHVGADLLMRRCYHPKDWFHEISVTNSRGELKTGPATEQYIIAGPLCFNGDIIARDISLPEIEPGDYLLIHDAGAYTLSMYSRHTSRQTPKVLGYEDEGANFRLLKKRETPDDVYSFWR